MIAKPKDWQTKLVGREVKVLSTRVSHVIQGEDTPGCRHGTLIDYVSEDGVVKQFRVAFAPADWADFPVDEVELVN